MSPAICSRTNWSKGLLVFEVFVAVRFSVAADHLEVGNIITDLDFRVYRSRHCKQGSREQNCDKGIGFHLSSQMILVLQSSKTGTESAVWVSKTGESSFSYPGRSPTVSSLLNNTVELTWPTIRQLTTFRSNAEFEIRLQVHRMRFASVVLLSVLLPFSIAHSQDRPVVIIHRQGEHHCHTFRIPAIAITKEGTLLAVYDMRYNSRRDLQEHIDIGLSRSTDGGKTWQDPQPIMDMGTFGGLPQSQNGCSDPNILVDAGTGEIFVSALWTHGKPGTHQWKGNGSEPGLEVSKSSQFMVVRSTDDGKSWTEPENWTKQLKNPQWYLFAPAPGNGITMTDGTLVMPTQGRDHNGLPFSNLMYSKDHGRTWVVSAPARDDTSECAVAELNDGSLMINIRDNRNRGDKSDTNGRAVSVTTDLGKTWTVHPSDHGALPEPVCMASLISHRLSDGRHVLFFSNPNSKSRREKMTVRMSLDDGTTWPKERQILLDEKGGAYSSLVMVNDQTLGILYESSRADLVFQTIALDDFDL